jgi:hypothetical protein
MTANSPVELNAADLTQRIVFVMISFGQSKYRT